MGNQYWKEFLHRADGYLWFNMRGFHFINAKCSAPLEGFFQSLDSQASCVPLDRAEIAFILVRIRGLQDSVVELAGEYIL